MDFLSRKVFFPVDFFYCGTSRILILGESRLVRGIPVLLFCVKFCDLPVGSIYLYSLAGERAKGESDFLFLIILLLWSFLLNALVYTVNFLLFGAWEYQTFVWIVLMMIGLFLSHRSNVRILLPEARG